MKKLFILVLTLSSMSAFAESYKCSVQGVSASAPTHGMAIYEAAKKCSETSAVPIMCTFASAKCTKVTVSAAAVACEMNTGIKLFFAHGNSVDEAKLALIEQCEGGYAIPSMCSTFNANCIGLN